MFYREYIKSPGFNYVNPSLDQYLPTIHLSIVFLFIFDEEFTIGNVLKVHKLQLLHELVRLVEIQVQLLQHALQRVMEPILKLQLIHELAFQHALQSVMEPILKLQVLHELAFQHALQRIMELTYMLI